MKCFHRLLPVLSLALLASGCSLFERAAAPAGSDAPEEQRIDERDLPIDSKITAVTRKRLVDGLSLAWEVPSEPTDGFVIRYGTDPKELTSEISVSTSDLQREQDPIYGPVFRYIIEDVPAGKPLYVSIAARRGELISEFTPTISESRSRAVEY